MRITVLLAASLSAALGAGGCTPAAEPDDVDPTETATGTDALLGIGRGEQNSANNLKDGEMCSRSTTGPPARAPPSR